MIAAVCQRTRKEIMEDEKKNVKVKAAALGAFGAVLERSRSFAGDGFLFRLPLGILWKKSRMILMADTIGELKEIIEPSVPRWNYGDFTTGKYHVLEEELLYWSHASLEAPLNDDGVRRYEKVFRELFPRQAEEIWGKTR